MKLGSEVEVHPQKETKMTLRELLQGMLPIEATDAVLTKISRACCRFLGFPEKCSCERTTLESDAWLSWPWNRLSKIVSRMAIRVKKRFKALKQQPVLA